VAQQNLIYLKDKEKTKKTEEARGTQENREREQRKSQSQEKEKKQPKEGGRKKRNNMDKFECKICRGRSGLQKAPQLELRSL